MPLQCSLGPLVQRYLSSINAGNMLAICKETMQARVRVMGVGGGLMQQQAMRLSSDNSRRTHGVLARCWQRVLAGCSEQMLWYCAG